MRDGINDYVVQGNQNAVNPAQQDTKVVAHSRRTIAPAQSETVRRRLTEQGGAAKNGRAK